MTARKRPTVPQRKASREPPQRLHNMSAPPRATISFRLVTARGPVQDDLPASGLRWVCRIDVPGLFHSPPACDSPDIAQRAVWQDVFELQRCVLAQALAEEGGHTRPDRELGERVQAMPVDAVLDALRDVARRADPAALGLPAFGLLRSVRGTQSRQRTGQMRLAVAVLARRRGDIFLRQADPLPPASLIDALDLWTPEPAEAHEAQR